MRALSVLLLLIVSYGVSSNYNKSLLLDTLADKPKELFKAYYVLFNKDSEYDINSQIGLQKYIVFKENLKRIKEDNEKRGAIVYGITPFTDLTDKEFSDLYLMEPQSTIYLDRNYVNESENLELESFSNTIQEVDHRPKMQPIKRQGNCGSCWAFATIAAVEGNYNIKFNNALSFSEQYLVNCDELDRACIGGSSSRPYIFMKFNGNLLSENYKYTGKREFCTSETNANAQYNVTGYDSCSNCSIEEYMKILSEGPVSVAMRSGSSNLKNYKPASLDIPWVPYEPCNDVDHIVAAVGAKYIEGKLHIIVRNSWGTDWGFQGYFTVPADNSCLITKWAFKPRISEDSKPNSVGGATIYRQCENDNGIEISDGVPDFVAQYGSTIKGFASGPITTALALYTEPNCKGIEQLVNDSMRTKCFTTRFFNAIEYRSIALHKPAGNGCAWFYENTCKSGKWVKICKNYSNLQLAGINISNVKSIIIGGLQQLECGIEAITLFDQIGFKGNSVTLPYKYLGYNNLDDQESFRNIAKVAKSISFKRVPGPEKLNCEY